jgi:hypothetical protein
MRLMKLLIVGCRVAEMSMLCVDEEERSEGGRGDYL